MTLSAIARKAGPYTANGSNKVFAYSFRILASDDIDVYVDDVLQSPAAYSVSGVGNDSGGNVTFVTAPLANAVVWIFGEHAIEQQNDIQEGGQLSSAGLETSLDRLTMMLWEQVKERLERIPFFKRTLGSTLRNMQLPDPEASKVLGMNATNNGWAWYSTTPLGAPTDSLNVSHTPGGAGAVATTVKVALNQFPTVKDFGAVGDGVTDDRAKFAAADAVGPFIVPAGTYVIGSGLTISNDMVLLPGAVIAPSAAQTVTINGAIDAGIWQIFGGDGTVLFGSYAHAPYIYPQWFGAVGDDSADDTAALQAWIAAAEGATYHGILYLPPGIYRHNASLTLTKNLTIMGAGWDSVLKNVGSAHSIASTAGGGDATIAMKLSDFKIDQASATGTTADGIHFEKVSNHLRIERVWVDQARQDGILLQGVVVAFENTTYPVLINNWVAGCGRDGLRIVGPCNAGTAMGGRIGSNTRYNINLDDPDNSFPNTWTFIGIDCPGAGTAGVRDNGHTNRFFGVRFEGTSGPQDVLLDVNCSSSQWFGTEYSGGGATEITNNSLSSPAAFGKDDRFLRNFHPNGHLWYWDEQDDIQRQLPKRGIATITLPAQSAGEETTIVWAPIYRADTSIIIERVSFIPQAAITGAAGDNMRFTIFINSGSGGVGTAFRLETFWSGKNAIAYQDYNLMDKDTGGASPNMNADDVIIFRKDSNGAGMLMPQLTVQIEYRGGSH